MTQATAGLDAATVRDIRARQREEYKATLARVVELEESLRSLGSPVTDVQRWELEPDMAVELRRSHESLARRVRCPEVH